MSRIKLKIVGESGAGLLSTGEIVMRSLQAMGFYVVADREYPSLIKGGHSCFTINASIDPIFGLSEEVEVMMAIDRQSLEAYFNDLKKGGTLIYGYERPLNLKDEMAKAKRRGVKVVHAFSREISRSQGGNVLMVNIVLVGMLWKVMGFDYKYVKAEVERQFASKPKLLALDLKCLKAGYGAVSQELEFGVPDAAARKAGKKRILVNGGKALALGAVHCGVRAYYAYPMSPSSGILTDLAKMAGETGMLVKQAEDEITVANLALGSMFMGTRALCATSGGGYDLMTETVSLAGIIENPLVVIIAQRPGPGTGLPTWTGQGDLNLAIYSSHGEFARMVIGVGDTEDSFELIQHAMNYAEKYQIPVVVLSEKQIMEGKWTVEPFKQKTVKIERGLVTGGDLKSLENSDRYRVTKDGLSKRWIPGSADAYYFANGDEHWEDGVLTEDGEKAAKMYAKRMKKMKLIEKEMPEPEVFGVAKGADISFVGWGSTKNVMKDVIASMRAKGVKVNYLHYSYLWPLKVGRLKKFFRENKNVHLIEGNYTGQLGGLIEKEAGSVGKDRGVDFAGRFLKWDGRPFFVENVLEYLRKNLK